MRDAKTLGLICDSCGCLFQKARVEGGGESYRRGPYRAVVREAVQACGRAQGRNEMRERGQGEGSAPSDWMSAGMPSVVFSMRYRCPTVTPNTNLSQGVAYPPHMEPALRRIISSCSLMSSILLAWSRDLPARSG